MPEQPRLVQHVHAVRDRVREPVGDDHPTGRIPEPAMATGVGALHSDRPDTAPVHHRRSLPGIAATFARYRESTARSASAAVTAARPASSSRTGTRSPAPSLGLRAAVRCVQPPQSRSLPHPGRLPAPLDRLAQGQPLDLG